MSRVSVNVHIKYQNGKKCDLCDFNLGMVVDARWAGLRISSTADLWDFQTQQALEFTQNGEKKQKPSWLCRLKHTVEVRSKENDQTGLS